MKFNLLFNKKIFKNLRFKRLLSKFPRVKQIINLISDLDTKHNLSNQNSTQLNDFILLKKNLKSYISMPWDPEKKQLITVEDYYKQINDTFSEKVSLLDSTQPIKLENLENTICTKNDMHKLCQSHGGNVFEHSQWSALHVCLWFVDKLILVKNMNKFIDIAIIAAFFHDLGKAGDCYFNVYDNKKYGDGNELKHPRISADLISGKQLYIIECDNVIKKEININIILKELFNLEDYQIELISFIAYMHWEFGKLNIHIEGKTDDDKMENYVKEFILGFQLYINDKIIEKSKPSITRYTTDLKLINQHLTQKNDIDIISLLKLCILISCADIASGTNKRLINNFPNDYLSKLKYLSSDPWVKFNMDTKYQVYSEKLITYFQTILQ